MKKERLKIHIVSELGWLLKGNGVNTAYRQMVEMLRERDDLVVVLNWRGRGDVYHAHSYGLVYFLRGIGYKGRRIHTVHVIPDTVRGSIPLWQLMMPAFRWYFKQVYRYADVCIAISPMVEQAVRQLSPRSRIFNLYNPVPVEYWKRTPEMRRKGREMLGLKEDEFVILGVGQIIGRKGVEEFVDIGEAIPEATFVWAGGRPFGPLSEGVMRINERLAKVPGHIKFAGMFELADMPPIYAAADLFLFPSIQENCPMAPLEAAASGMPVIFKDIPEYELLYEHPYLKARDKNEFITMTKRMMSDQDFYRQGMKMSKELLQQFDKTAITAKLVGLYRELYTAR